MIWLEERIGIVETLNECSIDQVFSSGEGIYVLNSTARPRGKGTTHLDFLEIGRELRGRRLKSPPKFMGVVLMVIFFILLEEVLNLFKFFLIILEPESLLGILLFLENS